jgi:glycosyltransferase involved in cell wall biosynthesis
MKILHLIDSGGLYGAEVMLLNLIQAQQSLGLMPVLGSIRRVGAKEKEIEREAKRVGITVHSFPMQSGLSIQGIRAILSFLRGQAIDLVHSHGYKTNIFFGMLPRFIRRVPVVATVHGYTSTSTLSNMRRNEILDGLFLRFLDRVVLVNEAMLSLPRLHKIGRNRLTIIHNGIDLTPSAIEQPVDPVLQATVRRFAAGRKIVASFGRLSREKGFNHLIAAVHLLRLEGREDFCLLLAGEGKQREELEAQVRFCGLEGVVRFLGFVPNARALLPLVDCYVLPSLTEGLPMSLLEVMASATPLVATAVGGIPHVVTDERDALLVQSEDAAALASAMNRMLSDFQLATLLAEQARKTVCAGYSREQMAKQYLSVYQEFIREK